MGAPTSNFSAAFPVGCSVTNGDATRTTCVRGTWALPSAADAGTALFESFGAGFPGGASCPSPALATMQGATAYQLGVCFPVGADESRIVTCNGTAAVAQAYAPGCAPGTAKPAEPGDAMPLGCSADSASSVLVALCTPVSSGGGGFLPYVNALTPAQQAGVAVGSVALVAAIAGGVICLRRRQLARYRTEFMVDKSNVAVGVSEAAEKKPLL